MQHIIVGVFLLSSFPGLCQTELSETTLKERLSKYQNVSHLKAQFQQIRTIQRWQTEIKTSGTFQFQKKPFSEILWEIQSPSYTGFRFSEKGFATRLSQKAPWKTLKNKKVEEQMKPLFSWLSFDAEVISKDYKVEASMNKDLFTLTPLQKSSPLDKIVILGKKGVIDHVQLHEKTKDTISIRFEKVEILK